MTVREYLERPMVLRLEIARHERRIEDLRRQATRITSILSKNRVVSTKDPTFLQEILAEAADLENETLALEEELYRTCREIRGAIAAMEEKTLADVLELRYVEGLSWNEIADRTCYTLSWLYKLHNRGMEKINAQFIMHNEL